MPVPASSTAFAPTARTSRNTATASIPTSCCSTPTPRRCQGSLRWSDAHFGYRFGARAERADLTFDRRDNSRGMPKCRVVETEFSWGDDRALRHAWDETVIYEMHLRGFTMTHPAVPPPLRGTAAGMSSPEVVGHLHGLGVTAVELLPVHAFVDDRRLVEHGLANYWGYNSIGFFAPQPRYLASGLISEFQVLVRRLHDAGIEVILDVVYNHTGEGNQMGPTLSFRGIDNASYYRLLPDNPRHYIDDTGTGNSLNLQHPRVLQMVMDSLRYWVGVMHVDGFRFDLATTLGREPHGFERPRAFLRCHAPGPAARPRQADRRALGHRPGRLSARQLRAALGRMERPLPGHGAPVLARRCRRPAGAGVAPVRLGGSLRPPTSAGLGERQFRYRA